MNAYTVALKEQYPFLQGGQLECLTTSAVLDGERPEWKRPAVIVVPGGAYWMNSKREGIPVAAQFFARGFQVFVLTYLCAPDGVRYPEQLLELASAVDYVKKHAKELYVNPDEIFVVGFSAGGHLTGSLATGYSTVSGLAGVELDCKPTAVGLCYPVISEIHGHQGSYDNLLQGYSEEERRALAPTLNLDEAVSADTPPAFIWTTATDNAVPADNAVRYALALDRQGISYELHVYPKGQHGLSTGDEEVCPEIPYANCVTPWLDACAKYFRYYTVEKF